MFTSGPESARAARWGAGAPHADTNAQAAFGAQPRQPVPEPGALFERQEQLETSIARAGVARDELAQVLAAVNDQRERSWRNAGAAGERPAALTLDDVAELAERHARDAASTPDGLFSGVRRYIDDRFSPPSFDRWISYRNEHLSDSGARQLEAAFDAYVAAKTEMHVESEQLFELSRAASPLASQVGPVHLDAVREFYGARGVDVEREREVHVNWGAWRDNAWYNPRSEGIAFGDSPNNVSFALSQDVVAHEYTHFVMHQLQPDLARTMEASAIGESLGDTIAVAMDDGDWIVGEDAMHGGARELDPRVTLASHRMTGEEHHDAAVPNAAAVRIGQAVGREALGSIYISAMQKLDRDPTFTELARATWLASNELYGAGSAESGAVRDAWSAVLGIDGTSPVFA